jgi:hypothetical protein
MHADKQIHMHPIVADVQANIHRSIHTSITRDRQPGRLIYGWTNIQTYVHHAANQSFQAVTQTAT